MRTNSLAFRLFITAVAWVIVVLPIAGFLIYSLYRQEVETAFDRRISVLLTVILSDAIDHGENDPGVPRDVGEPLFEITQSGWYWQIKPLDGRPGKPVKSRSLGDGTLKVPSELNIEPNDREVRWANLEGPSEQNLRIAETVYVFGEGKKAGRYSVAVAGTLGEVEASLRLFRTRLSLALALAGVGLLAVTLFQVRFGLFPLLRVEKGLASIRNGSATRLDMELPREIEPLQVELNALLKSNQEIVERARTHVGNLAHALKTPLAVITNEAREDETPFARKVSEQAGIMADQVNLYLDRARMAARIGVIGRITEVRPVGESIMRALERIYRDKQLAFEVDCPATARFLGERQDLEEMLGNLLDNAAKWANTAVVLKATPMPEGYVPPAIASVPPEGKKPASKSSESIGSDAMAPVPLHWLEIQVDDDGPGLTPEQLASPIIRGRRLDETKPGSGLGHSIVADLAHSYGGRLTLAKADLGGLSARLLLPLSV